MQNKFINIYLDTSIIKKKYNNKLRVQKNGLDPMKIHLKFYFTYEHRGF